MLSVIFTQWTAGMTKWQENGLINNRYYYYFTQCQLVVFPKSMSDSKFPQVSRTLLSILADLNGVVVWNLSLISNSSHLFSKPLGTVLSAPIIIDFTVTFVFHSFVSSQATSRYLSFFFLLSFLCSP